MTRLIATSSVFALVSLSPVMAESGEETWDGAIEFSAANATGNAENTTLGIAADGLRVLGRYTHNLKGAVNYAEATVTNSDGETISEKTQDNWFVSYQLDTQLRDRTYAFGRVRYEQDAFSGFDDRTFLGGGVGHHVFQEEGRNWKIEGGPGYQISTIAEPDPVPDEFEDTQEELALYASSEFDILIRDGVSFDHDVYVTWTDPNTTLSTVFGLATKLTENMSSKVSYQVDFETDPPEGREDTDTLLKASLLFGF